MFISPYNPYDRYRRRAADRLAGVGVVVLIVGLAGGFGFWMGGLHAAHKIVYLQGQVDEHNQRNDQMQTTLTELSAEAQTAVMRYEQLQDTYQQAIPEGPMQNLTTLVRKQLDEGMDPQRLEFVIRSARPPRNCTEPETKRFVISTPSYTGPDSQVEIAEGVIAIKGSGSSASNAKGESEAWYDPSKSVSLEFIQKLTPTEAAALKAATKPAAEVAPKADPKTTKEPAEPLMKTDNKAGIMPLHHSVVSGNREYRFTIEEGARSFAKVTFDSCDYP